MLCCKKIVTISNLTNTLITTLGLSLVSISILSGCGKEKYQAKPIEPVQIASKLNNKDIASVEFKSYLINLGFKESDLPFANWGLNELTLCALYYHSKLDVAKAQLALANASLESSGLKQIPTLTGNLARSNQANGDIRPWAYSLNIEIPIETTQKRAIRIEEAQHLVEVARIDVADVAWQLRSQIAKDLLMYHENMAQQQLLAQELKQQDVLIKILEKRVQLGMVSNTELNAAKMQQQKSLFALNTEQSKAGEIIALLAADVGLNHEKFSQIKLKPLDVNATLMQQASNLEGPTAKITQENALLNRLDIRRGLAKYAAAEARIKMEVVKQTPDISLNPGFAFEFGDKVWSLGFSTLINLLNKNPTLIKEATQLREVEGAQFEGLQAKIIGDLDQHLAIYQASQENLKQVKQQQMVQMAYNQKIQRQFDAGLIDRLELTHNQMNTALIEKQLLAAQFKSLETALALEDMMQRPIFDDFILPNPSLANGLTESVGISHE
jgi:outer membrane protein, heavy metal efflux system